MKRFVGCAVLLVIGSSHAGVATAAPLPVFHLEVPADVPRAQHVAPGGEGRLVLVATNDTTVAGEPVVEGVHLSADAVLAQYAFIASTPATCPPPVAAAVGGTRTLRFDLATLAPGATLTCTYRIVRAAGSRDDLQFRTCGGSGINALCGFLEDGLRFRIGTLPQATVTTERLGVPTANEATALYRITVRNLAERDVAYRTVGTGCWEFGGGLFGPPPFEIETNFAGACGAGTGFGAACVNLTGQQFSSMAFDVGPIAAGGEASCLVRLQRRPEFAGETLLTMPIRFWDERVVFADGGRGYDPGIARPGALLTLGVSPAIPAAGGASLLVLAALIILAARRARRARA